MSLIACAFICTIEANSYGGDFDNGELETAADRAQSFPDESSL